MANLLKVEQRPAPVSAPWMTLRQEMDRLFERMTAPFAFTGEPATLPSAFSAPAMDLCETDAAYKLTAELPGLTEKDVEVVLNGDTLTIKGSKTQQREEKEADYHFTERSYGEFRRAFALPDNVARDKIEAGVANGVLTVTLPKAASPEAKTIEVKPAA